MPDRDRLTIGPDCDGQLSASRLAEADCRKPTADLQ